MPWDMTPAEPDVLSLDGLIAWLETMPADGEYSWLGNCLYQQYAEHIGLGVGEDAYNAFVAATTGAAGNAEPWSIAIQQPHTFGAALDRARALRDAS